MNDVRTTRYACRDGTATRRHRLILPLLTVTLAAALAGCGGGGSDSAAAAASAVTPSTGATSTTGATSGTTTPAAGGTDAMASYRTCLANNGVTLPTPGAGAAGGAPAQGARPSGAPPSGAPNGGGGPGAGGGPGGAVGPGSTAAPPGVDADTWAYRSGRLCVAGAHRPGGDPGGSGRELTHALTPRRLRGGRRGSLPGPVRCRDGRLRG